MCFTSFHLSRSQIALAVTLFNFVTEFFLNMQPNTCTEKTILLPNVWLSKLFENAILCRRLDKIVCPRTQMTNIYTYTMDFSCNWSNNAIRITLFTLYLPLLFRQTV